MTQVGKLASSIERVSYSDLSGESSHQTRIRVLDALDAAIPSY